MEINTQTIMYLDSFFFLITKDYFETCYRYFIIVNAVACLYSAVSVGVSFTNQSNASIDLLLSIADLIFIILLFTGNASAAAIEILAQNGNSRLGWGKICTVTSKFCDRLTASIVLSTVASVVFALVVVLSMITLQKKSRWSDWRSIDGIEQRTCEKVAGIDGCVSLSLLFIECCLWWFGGWVFIILVFLVWSHEYRFGNFWDLGSLLRLLVGEIVEGDQNFMLICFLWMFGLVSYEWYG